MRHRVAHRKLGRVTEHRISMLRGQATALLRHEHLTTTVPKAKELRPFVERLITVAKRGLAAGDVGNRDGRRIFLDKCSICHGADAQGNPALGAPRLKNHSWVRDENREHLEEYVAYGGYAATSGDGSAREGRLSAVDVSGMPAWGTDSIMGLRDEQIVAVALFVKSLEKKKRPAPVSTHLRM